MLDVSKITFEVLKTMRYDDVGDYHGNKVYTYNFDNTTIQNAILLHEFIEYLLLDAEGIDIALIDKMSETPSLHKKLHYESHAYEVAHKIATKVEKEYIKRAKVDWKSYDHMVETIKVKRNTT